ncbi:negative elongation factor E-like, partial [Carlito syrichta]|uniref:Negative elongation factor E-like n=1 Tax=Carlito syrichta TaxID=1868482 RepID=A0A3Q0E9A8_CARSF
MVDLTSTPGGLLDPHNRAPEEKEERFSRPENLRARPERETFLEKQRQIERDRKERDTERKRNRDRDTEGDRVTQRETEKQRDRKRK